MFTNETPIKSRRQSFKSFTHQLLINQHSKSSNQSQPQNHPMSNPSNSSDLIPPPTPSSPPQLPQSKQQQQQTLPSASLILRQTNKLNPRLPRPSNLAHSTIPHSYAYGAAPTVSELSDQSSTHHRRNTNTQSNPTTTTDQPTETRTPQPIPTNSSNTTSVMIASAFERARWAARANEALSINQTPSQSLNQPRPQDPSPPPISPSSLNQQNHIKKRRKSRRSLDPSYKYKPGDSATSDSEAGEGIADKRDKREKKAAAAVANQTTSSNSKQTNKKRRRTTTHQRDSETDSEEEGGEGIALTRGRRSIKPPTTFDNSNSKPARKRKAPNPKTPRNGTSNIGSETESHQSTLNQSTRRRTVSNRGTSDGNRTDDQSSIVSKPPTATFYLEHPDSPETSRIPNEEDHTMGTTDDSRFTLGTGVESYEYEEEERIVKALEAEERANHHHQPAHDEASQEMENSVSLEDSQNRSSDLMRRSQSNSHHSDSYQRSDSGLIELEQIVATSKLQSQSQPKLRKLPINKPSNHLNPITPIEELDETRLSSPPPPSPIRKSSRQVGFGTLVGSKVLRQVSKLSKYSGSFYLKSALLIFLLALMINSIRVGDLPMSIFSRKRSSPNVFIKPEKPIENIEELVTRLTNLESTLSKISMGTESITNSLSTSISETRIEMFQRIGSIELSIEDQIRMIEAVRESHEGKLIKIDTSFSEVRKQVSLGAVSIGRLEKSLAGLNKEIIGIEDRIQQALNDQSNSGNQEGLNGILMDPVTGEWKLDSRLMNYLESLYVSREKVEKSLMERDEKLRNWISKEIGNQPSGTGRVGEGKNVLNSIEETDELNQIISQSILRFSLTDGGINQPDYALFSGGARIIPDLTSATFDIKPKGFIKSTLSSLIGRGNLVIARGPSTVLEPDRSIGKCWPMNGNLGQIGIALARKIVVKEIVIEHVQFSLAYELDSALREFEVLGYDEVRKAWRTLGNGTFDIFDSKVNSIQRFEMNYQGDDDDQFETGLVVLKVLSNHGNPEFTCLYRIRVLGERRNLGNGLVDHQSSSHEQEQEQERIEMV